MKSSILTASAPEIAHRFDAAGSTRWKCTAYTVTFSPTGDRLAVGTGAFHGGGAITMVDLASERQVSRLAEKARPKSLGPTISCLGLPNSPTAKRARSGPGTVPLASWACAPPAQDIGSPSTRAVNSPSGGRGVASDAGNYRARVDLAASRCMPNAGCSLLCQGWHCGGDSV